MATKEATLASRIALLLKSPTPRYGEILELSARLAALDPDNVRFSVDASHVDRLGQELVSRKEIALAELIKNAYDADAHQVEVTFLHDCLIIDDDGNGMTRDELIQGFMRISTRMKEDNPKSPRLGRDRAGSKGIGRFAAQRLGRALRIETRPATGGGRPLQIDIDWDQFSGHRELIAVPSHLTPGSRKTPGTTLTVSGLRDKWDDEALQTASLFIGPLVQPFSLSGKKLKAGRAADFQVAIRHIDGTRQTAVDVLRPLYDLALAEISAYVPKDGVPRLSVRSKRLDLQVLDEPLTPGKDRLAKSVTVYDELDGVKLRAYYYIRAKPWMPGGEEGSILGEALAKQGGMRLYRNGFRVHPYGEQGDDWLSLDYGYALRQVMLAAYSNRNFLGFIEVADRKGDRFQETSSREGLLVTPAFEQLRTFGITTLLEAVRIINESAAKRQAQIDKAVTGDSIRATLRRAVQNVEALRVAKGRERDRLASSIISDIRKIDRDSTKLEKRRLQEMGMLRVLATLGISIVEFVHETRNSLTYLLANVSGIIAKSENDRLTRDATDLQSNLKRLRQYTDYFHQVISNNERLDLKPVEMHKTLTEFRRFAYPLAASLGIELVTTVQGSARLYTIEMHESEWSSIFLNLLSNSIKAIRRANSRPGHVEIVASAEGGKVVVKFNDNGDGIPDEHRTRVFDPFFSTTRMVDPRANVQEDLSGMGLGLKIVKDIVIASGGTIEVSNPMDGFSTTIRLTMPRASDQDLG